MPEYIERNMILAKGAPIPGCFCNMISAWDVKNLPAADVAPIVHGKWKNGNSICPICGMDKFSGLDADIWADWQPKFCPNCGAKMDIKD
ncbi:hypothetical protein D7X33_16510 [Butyricicoccus sp. 1XD8-22]|nr:hypothetical protein D7X33_16510 [Butyricicoccus sp. 1XD8-22]